MKQIFSKDILKRGFVENYETVEEITNHINKQFQKFKNTEFPKLEKVLLDTFN